MDTFLNTKVERVESITVEDLKKDLRSEFFELTSDIQNSSAVLEKEHLQVYLRIRPFTSAETENGESQDCVTIQAPDTVLLKAPRTSLSARQSDKAVPQTAQRFQFSQVYGPETSQRDIFDGTVKGLVKDVLEGRNSLIFTYGVTNAGKTFTFIGPEEDPGILPRSLNLIFGSVEGQVYAQTTLKPHRCREYITLTEEQQNEEATSKRNLFRLLRENESHKSLTNQSSSRTTLEGSALGDADALVNEEGFSLDVGDHTKFSVWVSFCEIYNENIHDLLEPVPSSSVRRTVLRLAQDVKGNAFIKDLKWVQVNSAEEAFKVLKLGKKNQSISSTKLNQLSSRSHSIFSIRILRIDDSSSPRFQTVSELSLCDLAGSERCAKTQNKGDRLKEAGNINTSLLSLGKCINALRQSQQARQHVPFRESKLTHYLQSFFTGRGKACMIVNINQCASMYDETLNVLKFSAVAQKVVVLTHKSIPVVVKKSAREVSFIINNADRQKLRRSSMVRWDTSLEDVQESMDSDEEDDDEEEESMMEDTVQETEDEGKETVLLDKDAYEGQLRLLEELQELLQKERNTNLSLEARVREEVTKEFTELFSQMQADYDDRLTKERELMEERCERRLEILKNLVRKSSSEDDDDAASEAKVSVTSQDEKPASLTGMIDSMYSDLAGIREDAEAAKSCLVISDPHMSTTLIDHKKKATELSEELSKTQTLLSVKSQELESLGCQLKDFEETKRRLDCQDQKVMDLMEMCDQKDQMISKLQISLDQHVEFTTKDKALIDSIKDELIQLKKNCTCSDQKGWGSRVENRKRRPEGEVQEQPPKKKGELEGCTIPEVNSQGGCDNSTLDVEGQLECLRVESRRKDEHIVDMKRQHQTLEFCIQDLKSELKQAEGCRDNVLKEKEHLTAEISALQKRGEEQQQQKLSDLETQLSSMEARLVAAQKEYGAVKTELVSMETSKAESERACHSAQIRLAEQDNKLKEKTDLAEKLQQEVMQLTQNIKTSSLQQPGFQRCHDDLKALQKELSISQEECQKRGERVKVLEQQLKEQIEQEHELRRVITELQAEVKTLKEAIARQEEQANSHQMKSEAEEKAEKEAMLLAREEELKQKEAALSQKEKWLSQSEQELIDQQKILKEREEKLVGQQNSLKELQSSKDITENSTEINKNTTDGEANLAQKEAMLAEKETQLSQLERSLKEAQERLETQETQAVQEARRKEVERRRELLAVAEEAIAQKDADLKKREEEIQRLKEDVKTHSDKVKSLTLDLERRDDDMSDLKDKLSDSKKQIQQVQKEISSMRDIEKSLRQKLHHLEKVKAQLQSDVSSRDRTILQLKSEASSDSKADGHFQLYQKACKDLQAHERVIEDMRLALTEQEETQTQLDLELEAREDHINELTQELEKLRGLVLEPRNGREALPLSTSLSSDDITQAREELKKAQENLKLADEKHQADRNKWLEEKKALIQQAKETEERRYQDMRRYADDRERFASQQTEMESLSARLCTREQEMEAWRKERDVLVSALEVQLQKLLSSNAEKDKQIQALKSSNTLSPPERADVRVEELQGQLSERHAEILSLQEKLSALQDNQRERETSTHRDSSTQTLSAEECVLPRPLDSSTLKQCQIRGSVSSQDSSSSYPSVLDSSEISTEAGRRSRFPRPELEISFSPLQPDRFALKRQGEESAVTVKIARSARKRKSSEMEKKGNRSNKARTKRALDHQTQDGVESENRRNLRSKNTPRLGVHEEECSPASDAKSLQNSQSSLRSKKEATFQKIGDFLQGSPTFLGSKAKKFMGLVSGRTPDSASGPSLSLKPKRSKRKLHRLEISSPLDIPAPIVGRDTDEKDSDHLIIKRRLRTRNFK